MATKKNTDLNKARSIGIGFDEQPPSSNPEMQAGAHWARARKPVARECMLLLQRTLKAWGNPDANEGGPMAAKKIIARAPTGKLAAEILAAVQAQAATPSS